MKLVVIESPYAGDIEQNLMYLREAMADCFARNEAPFASHALYTQPGVLRDEDPAERSLGINAGLLWGAMADLVAVYIDLGMSKGMELGLEAHEKNGTTIEYRTLEGWSLEKRE